MDLTFTNSTDAGDALTELADPIKYRDYLQTTSRFTGYSWRNIFLIYKQMPYATKLVDFKNWKEQYGRTILQGSTSIKINVPIEQKPKKILVDKTDPITGIAVLDKNGKRIMEDVIIETPVQFKQANFFDISQTKGTPFFILAGDVMSDEALRGVFTDVIKAMASADEYDDYYGMIRQIVLERLENNDNFVIDSVVCVVCFRFGVDVGDINLDIRADAETLEIIVKEADGIITEIEDRFAVICKERGLDPMTLHTTAESETLSTDEPQYRKELRTETIAGVEFEQYAVKTLTADEPTETPENITPPLSTAVKISEAETPLEPPIPPVKSKEPFEPPTLMYFPDPSITITERNEYGYTRPELLPLHKDRAVTLFLRDMTVYLLYKDNTEVMALKITDIQNHDGIFGVAYGVWLNDREYIYLSSGKPQDRLEAKFIFDDGDSFAIYQMEPDGSLNAYKSYEEIEKHGLDINRRKYNLVYTAPLPAPPSDCPSGLFMWVNAERLDDYNGRALAISDVLSIKKDEIITSYYTNGRTFRELLSFTGEEGRKYRRRMKIEATEDAIIPVVEVMENEIKEIVQEKQESENIIPVKQEQEPVIFSTQETVQPQQQAETPIITETQPQVTTSPQTPQPQTESAALQSTEPPSAPPNKPKPPPSLPVIRSEAAVYRFSLKEAEVFNALEAHDISRRTDIECAKMIDEAIQTHKKGDNTYDLTTPAVKLTKKYGKERMKWVLAQHIRARQNGFTDESISWANAGMEEEPGNGDIPPAFSINTHYSVLEVFLNEVRAILNKKTFTDLMKTAKRKSDAHNKSNG